jgi:outer membrane receptor protein involved in Fe transport
VLTFQRSLQAGVAAFAIAISTVGVASPALAQSNITLPAASLEDSLNALSRQTGAQILVDQTLLRGKNAPAVQRVDSVGAALAQLLRGAGLTWQKRGDAFLIVRGSAPSRPVVRQAPAPRPKPISAPAQTGGDIVPSEEPRDIIVTGSRIARADLESPMPVSVTRMEESFSLGITNAYDALKRDPALGVGLDSSVGCVDCNTGTDTGLGALNLRNLGINRTLTLIDGQRRVSALSGASAVDPNMIPVGMIDRIEVVTGGAAAVYGADAVTGAVNIITKKNVDGLNLRATAGISEKGDAERFMVSLSAGGAFDSGRGAFSIGGTYSGTQPFYYRDRFAAESAPNYIPNPENTGPRDGISDTIIADDLKIIYLDWTPNVFFKNQEYYIDNGQMREANYDKLLTPGQLSNGIGGDGRNLLDVGQFAARTRTASIMGRFTYELTDAIEYGAYFSYADVTYDTDSLFFRVDHRSTFVPKAYFDNPYLPEDLRQFMLDNDLTEIAVRRGYGNLPVKKLSREQALLTVGQTLGGPLTDSLDWQLFWQYGRARLDAISRNNVVYDFNWNDAWDVVADPVSGQPVCRSATARANGCLPFNFFSTDPVDPAVYEYFMRDRHEIKLNTQEIFGGSVNGALFALPYGDVAIAAGVERRKDRIDTRDDPAAHLITSGSEPPHPDVNASVTATEFFGEVVVPVLQDVRFFENLEIEGAYRHSNYSTFGGTDAWKAGLTWTPFRGVTLRGVRSRSVRAPNFSELYTPQSFRGVGTTPDPCDINGYFLTGNRTENCRALGIQAPLPLNFESYVTQGGNPDLQPETSNSLTLGVILQPRFIPNFDMTIDYWDINIQDVIASFSNRQTLNLCVDLPTIDNVFCSAIDRDPVDFSADNVRSVLINASRLRARGVDVGLNYRRPVGPGTVGLSFKGSYLISSVTRSTPGIDAGNVTNDGSFSNPRFKATLLTSYQLGDFSIALDTRFLSAANVNVNSASNEQYPDYKVPARVFNNVSLSYDINDRFQVGLGVNNLFNVRAPFLPGIFADSGVYDQVGRYFYGTIGLKL